jgi:cytochrome P450
LSDTFTGWVRDLLEFGDDPPRRKAAFEALGGYLLTTIEERKVNPGDDLISTLLHTPLPEESVVADLAGSVGGAETGAAGADAVMVPDSLVLGIAALTLIAGIDTTWSAIGSSIWHLATHPEDQQWLRDHPEGLPIAVEEFLRAYSPVTMGRVVTSDVEFAGCPMRAGDRVLMNFPAANRDPAAFDNADEVQLDRLNNRHIAFGVGIHRCAGSNLARMEMAVAIEEWLAAVPDFRLDPNAEVTWAGGQVRGPRRLPLLVEVAAR